MTGGSAAASPRGEALMSIGEVLNHLRSEFPDTTISKLRFLEAEGLVEPQRTASGYRKYTWSDVARLKFVLTAQRDQYLPLRVIRDQLAHGVSTLSEVPSAGAEPVEAKLSRADLLARTGLTERALQALEQHGLLAPLRGGGYDADSVEVAHAAAQLAEYGLEPRHLRAYRAAADREIGLFGQLVAPMIRQPDPAARARAAEAVRELAALTQRLHAALVRAGLRGSIGS
jgi:DNA-binding transcriptional MerR regulator